MGRFIVFIALSALIGLCGFMVIHGHQKQAQTGAQAQTVKQVSVRPPIGKCMNMGGALEAPNEGDWGYRIRERDFKQLKAAGFDTVRIPIKWSAHADDTAPYTLHPQILRRVDRLISQADAAGLKIIINVHHYDEISVDADMHLPRLYAFWDQLIAHYADAPDSVIFEFLNEPHTSMTPARVDQMNRDLLAKVRAKDQDRWVILGGGQWGTLDGLLATRPPYDPRAMVTFHYYSPFDFTHQGAPWAHKPVPLGQTWGTSEDRKRLAEDFSKAAKWRDQRGMPLLLGEFGVYVKVPDPQRALWTERVRSTAETVGFGWCYWDYATSLGIYDLSSERFRPGMLEALIPQDVSQVQ